MSTAVVETPLLDTTTVEDPTRRKPLVIGENDFTTVTEKICGLVERPKPPRAWYVAFGISWP
jgi:hypothetical protein